MLSMFLDVRYCITESILMRIPVECEPVFFIIKVLHLFLASLHVTDVNIKMPSSLVLTSLS